MFYKATKKFRELGIEDTYQRIGSEKYYDLLNGETVELSEVPQHLIDGKYIEVIKAKGVK